MTSCIPASLAFILVSLSLGQLGDGLNIFQGIYLVGIGWNEGSVGLALSLMGFTALLVQTFAGDLVDKTSMDRRIFLGAASILTACSALTVLLVHEGNTDHMLIFASKVIEGLSSSFIGPCLAALTLSNYGPKDFDMVMASNILWGHIGSVISAVLAGLLGYILYPNIKYCFLVIAFSAIMAVFFVQFIPEGDPLMGRGFHHVEQEEHVDGTNRKELIKSKESEAASYWEVFSDRKTCVLCLTGFFFQ
jgi:MFS family permease